MLEICDEPGNVGGCREMRVLFYRVLGGCLNKCLSVLDVRAKGEGFQSTGDICCARKGWMIPYG